jgi:hypothetical protein
MRTRRSWRNQDRLFKALTPRCDVEALVLKVRKNRCWDCACYPKGGRDRGTCSKKGKMVSGITVDEPCFSNRIGKIK